MVMKKMTFISIMFLVIAGNVSCNAQESKTENTGRTAAGIEAYYFHYTNRCITCRTVESEAKASLKNLYGNKVTFLSLNLEEELGKTEAKKLGVSGQTLLIVVGSKKINLTNEGFMYARSNPEKFKAAIKEKVDALLMQ